MWVRKQNVQGKSKQKKLRKRERKHEKENGERKKEQ